MQIGIDQWGDNTWKYNDIANLQTYPLLSFVCISIFYIIIQLYYYQLSAIYLHSHLILFSIIEYLKY